MGASAAHALPPLTPRLGTTDELCNLRSAISSAVYHLVGSLAAVAASRASLGNGRTDQSSPHPLRGAG